MAEWLIGRRRSVIVALLLVAAYTVFVGADAPVVRAAIMATMLLLASLFLASLLLGSLLVIAVDPGHGGHDPGAVGRGRTKEKDVALAIGKLLADSPAEHEGH